MIPKASLRDKSHFQKLVRSIYYLDNKNISMFSLGNNRIIADQGSEVSNTQNETDPTNPKGEVYFGIGLFK